MDNYNYHTPDNTTRLNKHIDDAFIELDVHRNSINRLTEENLELNRKIKRLTDEVHSLRVFLGLFSIIAVVIWFIQGYLY